MSEIVIFHIFLWNSVLSIKSINNLQWLNKLKQRHINFFILFSFKIVFQIITVHHEVNKNDNNDPCKISCKSSFWPFIIIFSYRIIERFFAAQNWSKEKSKEGYDCSMLFNEKKIQYFLSGNQFLGQKKTELMSFLFTFKKHSLAQVKLVIIIFIMDFFYFYLRHELYNKVKQTTLILLFFV